MSKKIQNKRTLRERPVAESAALADICSRSLWLHVRCLAYSATGRLQFLGVIKNMKILEIWVAGIARFGH
jgi:hypothetical protein